MYSSYKCIDLFGFKTYEFDHKLLTSNLLISRAVFATSSSTMCQMIAVDVLWANVWMAILQSVTVTRSFLAMPSRSWQQLNQIDIVGIKKSLKIGTVSEFFTRICPSCYIYPLKTVTCGSTCRIRTTIVQSEKLVKVLCDNKEEVCVLKMKRRWIPLPTEVIPFLVFINILVFWYVINGCFDVLRVVITISHSPEYMGLRGNWLVFQL